ncbi:tape measure protein [Sodalis sp. RH19]|uniref:tape measure protein n=1 Tax=Sodalis sp. RH19 TaxID=3394334 RepID=UPI0039B53062
MTNKIVNKTINQVVFEVSASSYQNTLKKIKSIGAAWEAINKKVAGKGLSGTGGIDKQFNRIRSVNSKISASADATAKKVESAQARIDKAQAKAVNQGYRRQLRAKDVIGTTHIQNQSRHGLDYQSQMNKISSVKPHLTGINSLNAQLATGAVSVSHYRAGVAALGAELRRARPAAAGLKAEVSGLGHVLGIAGIAYSAFATGRSITTQGQNIENLSAAMQMVAGSSQKAQEEMAYVRTEAQRLGLDLNSAGKEYVRFAIAARGKLDLGQIHSVFSSMSEYATAVGANADESGRALLALNQMLSKSNVQSEELMPVNWLTI